MDPLILFLMRMDKVLQDQSLQIRSLLMKTPIHQLVPLVLRIYQIQNILPHPHLKF